MNKGKGNEKTSNGGFMTSYIQKHHLHDTSWVNAPPRTGPIMTAIKKTLNTMLV